MPNFFEQTFPRNLQDVDKNYIPAPSDLFPMVIIKPLTQIEIDQATQERETSLLQKSCKMNVLTRGDLIVRMFKHFKVHKINIKLELEKPVNYSKIRQSINKLLIEKHQISEMESMGIHRNDDPVLFFLFFLAIAIDIGELTDNQLKGLLWNRYLKLPPLDEYFSSVDGKPRVPLFHYALHDGFSICMLYTFKSGLRTQFSKRLLADIKYYIKYIIKSKKNKNFLPPPIN